MDDRAFMVNARPLPAGGAVLVIHDLTEMRRLEAVRRDFVANVSHELKTPLTSISGYAETLLSDPPDPDTARRFTATILSNARRMQRLVDSLLDLSRIEAGTWRPEREMFDLGTAVREAWIPLAERAGRRRVSLATEIGDEARTITADPGALDQVLRNLLENAIRYAPDGSSIVVEARVEGEGIAITVADAGAGIPREHLPRIFERFYRADPSRSRDEGGTGLGLAIVRHLVEGHGGRVSAESTLGEGTRITCWFPGTSPP
jgi:signal transduction histidine kinase